MKTDFFVIKSETKEKFLSEMQSALAEALKTVTTAPEKESACAYFAVAVLKGQNGEEYYNILALAEEKEFKNALGGSLIALAELGLKEAPDNVQSLFKMNDAEKALEKAFSVKAPEPALAPEEKTAPAPEEKQEEKEFSFLVTFNDRTEKEFSATGVNDVKAYEKVIQDIKENHAPLYPVSVTAKEV